MLHKLIPLESFVLLALILYVALDCFLVAVLTHRINVVAAGPELASPENLRDLRVKREELSCSETFDYLDDLFWRLHGNSLNEEVHMILVCSNFNEPDLIRNLNLSTHFLEGLLNCFCENLLSELCRTNEVVEKQ